MGGWGWVREVGVVELGVEALPTGVAEIPAGAWKVPSTSLSTPATLNPTPHSPRILPPPHPLPHPPPKPPRRLEGAVNLPFRPRIAPYLVTTTLGVDPTSGLISSQLDEFSVPGWKLLAGALLGPWAGPEPAPPVLELRRQAAAAGARGVVGV